MSEVREHSSRLTPAEVHSSEDERERTNGQRQAGWKGRGRRSFWRGLGTERLKGREGGRLTLESRGRGGVIDRAEGRDGDDSDRGRRTHVHEMGRYGYISSLDLFLKSEHWNRARD